ncbi:MAG: serpin family protein [Bdellovibrionales bacterium]|nr:serpin family protein [Bdellovibrionales bacterium]
MKFMNKMFRVSDGSPKLGVDFRNISTAAKVKAKTMAKASTVPSVQMIVSVLFCALLLAGHSAGAQERGAGSRSPCQLNLLGFTRAETVFSQALMERLIFSNFQKGSDVNQVPNIVLPSAPVVNAMVMAALGAGEDTQTRDQFLTVLGIPSTTTFENLSETTAALIGRVQLDGDGLKSPISRLVNILFLRQGEVVTSHYQNAMKASFDAPVSLLNPDEIDRVNSFVETATDGKIKKLLNEINPLMKMILVSASYFKGGWVHPMKEGQTRPGDFFPFGSENSGGKASSYQVGMMRSVAPHGYLDRQTFEAVEIAIKGPYVSGQPGEVLRPRYSALLLLPKASSTLQDILPSLQEPGALDAMVSKMDRTENIELIVPKFDSTWDGDLIHPLIEMGLVSPFDITSNFSNMLETTPDGLVISQVKTSGFVEFNEKGIAGGGAAAIEMSLRGGPGTVERRIVFDHPFLLVLRDNELGYTFLEVAVFQPNRTNPDSTNPDRTELNGNGMSPPSRTQRWAR